MEHMMLRKGDMVRPMIRRYRYKGSNLAIVTNVKTDPETGILDKLQLWWLNGGHRRRVLWEPYPDMFEKVTERNHA